MAQVVRTRIIPTVITSSTKEYPDSALRGCLWDRRSVPMTERKDSKKGTTSAPAADSRAGLRNRVRCRGRGDHPWNSQPSQAVAELSHMDQSRRRVGLRTAFQTASGG